MISKLPKWVWAGGAVLSFCAGMVNVIAILGFVHKGITHVTGNTSLFSISLFERNWSDAVTLGSIVLSFFAGSVLAGFLIGDARLRMGRRYGVALAVESVLLFISARGFSGGHLYGEYFASLAVGLQNGIASTYSEAIVRTTHMTGILTDIGSLVGNQLRGIGGNGKRFKLLSSIFFSFLTGGLFGAYCYRRIDALAMTVPAVVIGTTAIGYEVFRRNMKKTMVSS